MTTRNFEDDDRKEYHKTTQSYTTKSQKFKLYYEAPTGDNKE